MVKLHGRVASGIGDLAGWMSLYSAEYSRAVGVTLEPGSLNVVLDRPWVMRHPDVRLEAEVVGVDVGLVRCRFNGFDCWVLRTDKNNRGEGDHALDVIEIVSPMHLRNTLGIADGDEVVIEVGPFLNGSTPALGRRP